MTTETSPATFDSRKRTILGDFREIFGDFWAYRFLLYQLTLRDIRIRYKQAIMGFGWAILMPLMVVGSGLIVRSAMAYLADQPFASEIIAGVALKAVPWSFFVSSIGFANQSLVRHFSLVTKIYFPREVLPLSAVLAGVFDSLIGGVALLIVLPFLGVDFSWGLLWIPCLAVLLICFTVAAGTFLACMNLFFRDVKYIVQVILTFGIFLTPVFFEPIMFGETGAQIMMLNPLSPILEGTRLGVVEGHNLFTPLISEAGTVVWQPWYLAYSAAWAIPGLFISLITFHRLEFLFAEYA
ncbi:MAG: hypothetical protein AAF581_19360 [Planctomycetota bacterium]